MERIPIARRPSARIDRLVRRHAGDHRALAVLFESLLAERGYQRPLALAIADLARDGAAPWPVRRAATLMLENMLLRIAAGDVGEHEFWLGELHIEATDIKNFRARLSRNNRVHQLDGLRATDAAIGDFFHLARRECRLTLGRYTFTPQEVIRRIEHDVLRSNGTRSQPDYGHPFVEEEAAHAVRQLPAVEQRLVEHFGDKAAIRWVAPRTPKEINSLIEYPMGTVVMTIKPPGSDVEIEIKRTGIRAPYPLDVIFERHGYILPNSHFLHGGAMEHLLAFEASQSSVMSRLYRSVHGLDASMSRTIHLATVFMIPTPHGQVDVLDYFTEPHVFRDHYREVRSNMERIVRELARANNKKYNEPINDLALTAEFLGQMKPAQAVQIGTSSFRLERIARYLGREGDVEYLKRGLGIEPTRDDGRRFADELLDEILCVYEPPGVPYRNYKQYVTAAFAVRANRLRANRNYIEVMAQTGTFWGTLLAARGHTEGESFVARNAGLRSVWEDGQWRIRIIFMDHDSMSFASRHEDRYYPLKSIRNVAKDGRYLLGGYFGSTPIKGSFEYLADIYRVSDLTRRRGMAAWRNAMKAAYDKTHQAMLTKPEVRRLFRPAFLERLNDWDEVVRAYFSSHRTEAERRAWKKSVRELLTPRGYNEGHVDEYIETVKRHWRYLRKLSFLF